MTTTFLFLDMIKPIVLSFFIGIASLVFAQEQDYIAIIEEARASRFIQHKGIVAGPSFNFLRGNPEVDGDDFQFERKYLVGYSVGVKLRSKILLKRVTLSTGLVYDQKGGKTHLRVEYFDAVDQKVKVGKQEYRYKYQYYTLPVHLEYGLGSKQHIKLMGGGMPVI